MRNHEEGMIEVVVDIGKSVAAENSTREEEEFKQFDIIPSIENSFSDHHYYGGSSKQVNYSKETCKNIMKEWKILEECLPDSIFVRGYEERIDLLRAVIIGPSSTPYHDCLFFFDIQFPLDYPNSPPKVYHHSFGFHMNPNLYDNGYVCISIINTAAGENSEKWIPNYSSILQVLLSIQALVLNDNPFFNHPDTNQNLPHEQKQSLAYKEYVYILCCKSILVILNNPPKNFEAFVSQYFRDRAEAILTSCKAYMDGFVKVGHTTTVTTDVDGEIVSKQFQDLARIAYSNLMEAFMKNGSSLENYYIIEEEIENDEFSANQVNQLQDKSSIGRRPCVLILFFALVLIWGYIIPALLGGKVGHK